MEIKSQEDQTKYDEAVRYAQEEARQKAEGKWTSAALKKQEKSEALSVYKEWFDEEYRAIQDYLNGKIKEPKITEKRGKYLYSDPLLYFECPEIFEKHIAGLSDDKCLFGDLSDIELAWIESARQLIKKYHAIVYENKDEKTEVVA